MTKQLALALCLCLLAACQSETPPPAPPASAAPEVPAATDTEGETKVPASPATTAAISSADLAAHIQIIASDEFAGRQPGGPGERKTVAYLTQEFKRLGLAPGNGDSYVQAVPMVEVTSEMSAPAQIALPDGTALALQPSTDIVVQTLRTDPSVEVKDSELVFAGFGVNAPELGWNDYAGLDVKGKTVVVLVNDPGFETGNAELFRGKAMTYYGRWTYKYEEALRQGAAAALIVHDTAGAAYGWDVVQSSFTGAEFDLAPVPGQAPPLPLRGWITSEAATQLFAKLGKDFAALRLAANQPGFKGEALGAKISMAVQSRVRTAESDNVVAKIVGSERPDEVIIYTAHWDHLGRTFGTPGDGIFNGAVDNATGVAAMLELAEAFMAAPEKPKRTLMFLAVTLEESGLLGSKYYTLNPLMPLAQTVATVNMDAMPVIGKTRDIVVIGYGNSELEELLKVEAAAQGRIVVPEPTPENGFYYRSDHFNFAIAGVPSLYAKAGIDHVDKGEAYGRETAADYVKNRYHKPGDHYDPSWDLSGTVQDLELFYALSLKLAQDQSWPNWYPGTEFRAARDAQRPATGVAGAP